MNFQTIWKKSKKALALILAITLFFGGWGNYDFSVMAANELTVKLSYDSKIYTGSEISLPDVTNVDASSADPTGPTGASITDYTSSWTDSNGGNVSGTVINAGTYTLTVKEMATETVTDPDTGEETEERKETGRTGTATFTVEQLDLASDNVSVSVGGNYIYSGNPIVPEKNNVTVKVGDHTLATELYDVAVTAGEDNTNAGSVKITVSAVENQSNVIGTNTTGAFTIAAKELTDNMVTISPTEETVTGENFKKAVTVSVKDTVNGAETSLTEGSDFEVEIPEMIEGNNYLIKVTGKGNYTGTVEKTFNLNYAADGTATLNGKTLAKNENGQDVYADSVKVTTGDDYQLAEAVDGETFTKEITYTSTPDDYIVYVKNKDGKITKVTLPEFTVDSDLPELTVTGPAANFDWAPSKDITVDVTGADYGVYYTTEKWNDLASPITQVPEGMTKLDGTTLKITASIFEDTTYYFYAIDNAGHVTEAEAVVNKVEAEVPTFSIEGNDENLAEGVYWKSSDDLVFTVKAEDQKNLSGLKEMIVEGPVTDGLECDFTEGEVSAAGTFTIKEAGTYTLKAVDVAGNESVVTTIKVEQDTQAPQVELGEPEGTNRSDNEEHIDDKIYWFGDANVSIPFTVNDALGSDETELAPYTVIFAANAEFTDADEVKVTANKATVPVELAAGEEGKTTYYFKVTDKAGNVGDVQQVTVGYDNTQPEISKVELTQLNAEIDDEWINLEESGASEPNKTKVAFSVTVSDAESGVRKIQYSPDGGSTWEDAECKVNEGVYTFETNETYKDDVKYVWKVRVANYVTPNMEDGAVEGLSNGKIDTTAPSTTAYIKFISDTEGANDLDRGTATDGKWSSNIYEMATNAWHKIWGKEIVTFEVYVQDVTSGIETITMSYNGTTIENLEKVNGVQAYTADDDLEGYIVYEGTITHDVNDSLAVKNFQIDALTDVAGNTSKKIVLGNAENKDIIYLDNVDPKLTSVQVVDEEDNVVETNAYIDDLYVYDATKKLVLTIEERFFAQENKPVYPTVVLSSRESGDSDFAPVADASVVWTDGGVGTVSLPSADGKEMEYQVTMTYNDPSGNSLATDGDLDVQNGTFTSKIFAIDDLAPEFVNYSVKGTGCYVKEASVLENNAENDDLVVEFTIDENPEYYAKSDKHAFSQENLIVKLYKDGSLVKTLQDGVDGSDTLTKIVDERNHKYSFVYDGVDTTQDNFYVTVEYKDVVGHLMVDENDSVTPGTFADGMYTSEEYIIDHVAPEFNIEYSPAANVVTKDGASKTTNDGEKETAPLAEHTAYYNDSIEVTLTFDEKYVNVVDAEGKKIDCNNDSKDPLDHFEISVTKDNVAIETPAITWKHEGTVHTAAFKIEALENHSNDGDYQFVVKYRDCAENAMVPATDEQGNLLNKDLTNLMSKEENDTVGVYTSPILVMDTTEPVVITSYSKTPAQTLDDGRDYFREETTFTVEVSDRNIRYKELKDVLSEMTAVNVDGDAIADTPQLAEDIKKIVDTGVQHTKGNEEAAVWSLSLPLSTEANYDIPVSYTDLAGNAAVVKFKSQDKAGNDVYAELGTAYTESVTVDKTLLEKDIFIKFTGNIEGANILSDMKADAEDGSWVSKIFRFISNAWMKLWGKTKIQFEIYLRDEIAGIHTITMQYKDENGNEYPCTLEKAKNNKKLTVDEEGIASEDEENGIAYVVYSGSIIIKEGTDLAVSDFEIVEVADKSTNTLGGIKFVNKIYLDAVAPEISIEIQDEDGSNAETAVVEKDKYFYEKSKKMVLTIDERFFGAEDEQKYPECTLYWTTVNADNEPSGPEKKEIVSTKETWVTRGDNKYSLSIDLELMDDKEVEYYVVLSYADPAENALEGANVEDGTFKSKHFVIDDIAPELVDYSVTTTNCDVDKASVLKNDLSNKDLKVNFTINDNPTYYENKGEDNNHAMAKSNLIITLCKEDGTVVDTLNHKGDKLVGEKGKVTGEEVEVNGRKHSYSFSYDGETKPATQEKFYVTVAYKDVVDHPMIDGRAEDAKVDRADGGKAVDVVDEEKGKYTSEMYIIDHVAPEFGITYSNATNVVEGTRNHDASKQVDSGKSPLKGYTAYYNDSIEVTLTFDEKYVNTDENGKLEHFEISVTKDNVAVETPAITWKHEGTVHTAAFKIEALENHSNDGDYQFVVTYQDCATNKMNASCDSNESAKEAGEYKSPILVMDTTAPVLTKVAYDTISKFNTVKGKDYVNAETTMTFTMTEHNPRPTSAYSITTLGKETATWTINGDTSTTTLKPVEMRNKGDEQTVTMTIVDWAGNKAVLANDNVRRSKTNTTFSDGTFTDKFTVDTVVPEIQLEYLTYTPDRPDVEGIDYFKQPITVKVTVNEHNFDEELFKQPVVKTDKDVVYKESGWSTSGDGDVHEKTFTFSKDNQYDLSIIGTDNALNKLKLNDAHDMAEKLDTRESKVSVSVAVDSTIPAIGDKVKPVIVIKPGSPQNETIDGQALYNTDVTYEVVVYDPLVNDYASGINDITFKVTGEDGTAATCDVNKQGGITNGTGVTVKRVGGDTKDLARGVDNKYTFNVTISSAVFNTNGIVLWVGANDVSTTHNEKEVEPIAIDITKPQVVVSYDNNDVSNEKYFHELRTATVTVTERNFSNDCLQFIVNGSDKELDFSLSKAGSGNRDDAVWVAHYTFSADEDYTVDVEVQDRAKNVGTVDYVGEAPQEFTIDMKKPIISVEYDNNNVLNELYYKEARTATITIEEHNFDADDVIIELTATDGGASIHTPGVSSWTSDGDYHRATIHYNYDGEFTFDIDFMDLATNEADDYDMDHFIVDLTAPELEIFDIEHMSANNGVVRPGVRYSDTNYDADGTVVVMTGYNNGVVEMTGARNITATGVEFKLDDFEYVQSMDDLYTMHATVYDLAGNSSEATVMFSVNRFGSVYTFDKNTAALVGENGKYYTNKEQQLVITETNVDTLEFKEITLNVNGKLITLKEGVDFEVALDGNETTWKQYTYKISEKNFVEEGTYILTIYSEDRATNTSDNNSKGKKIEFVVDKTNPSVLLSGIENAGQYRTSNKEVLIDVEDNVRLSKVVVTVDGVEVAVFDAAQIDEANGRLSVSVKDSSDWQLVEVTAYDAAGNIQSHEQMKVLVSANILVQWYRNTPLFWGSIGGTAALAALLWWFLVGKKKKKEDKEQQVK